MAAVAAVLHESLCPTRRRHLHSASEQQLCCPQHGHHYHHAMTDESAADGHHRHHHHRAACSNCKGCKASCPLCLFMMSAVLLMSPLSSAAAVDAAQCGGHGALLSASAATCACEPGFTPSTSDALICVPESGAPGSWAAKFAHGGESPEEHIWELMEKSAPASGHQPLSASDALHMLDRISGVIIDEDHSEHDHEHDGHDDHDDECGGHGHLHGSDCHCDDGYTVDPSDSSKCLLSTSSPDHHEDEHEHECGGHGHLHGSECHCDDGYAVDPSDSSKCLPSTSSPDHHEDEHEHECGGHGHLHGSECHCDDGYTVDPSDSSMCLASTSSPDHHDGDVCSGHGHLHGSECHCDDGYMVDPSDSSVCLPSTSSPDHHEDELEHECSGHGHLHGNECHCDEGWVMSSINTTMCVPQSTGRRMLAEQMCGGHGHVHGSGCHCDEGYFRDPSDSLNCLSSTSSTITADTLWTLTSTDLIAVAGWNGMLHMENLTAALPLIVSCQMDSSCALEVSKSDPHAGHDHGGEVEVWMAIVATLLFFVIPVIAILTPFLVSRVVNNGTFSMLFSLGNCFSAGLIFSLGIMHIIPHAVEAQFTVGMDYPLNYLLITLGFFITLFAEQIPGIYTNGSPLGVHTSGNSSSRSIPVRDGGKALPIKAFEPCCAEGHVEPPVQGKPAEGGDSTEPSIIYAVKDAENSSPSSFTMMQRVNALMPALVFFVASQFHACLEGLFVGITDNENDFWIFVGAVAAHKFFVALSFGMKVYALWDSSDVAQRWVLAILSFLWAALPALCVIIGYSISSSISGMSQLVLTSLSAGTFLYIGSFEILSEEFAHSHGGSTTCEPQAADGEPKWGSKPAHSYLKFAAITVAVGIVALFALIPHTH